MAELSYPRWINQELNVSVSGVTVIADHPDFCAGRHVNCEVPPAVAKPIQLTGGGRLRLHAFREGDDEPLTDFRTMVSGNWDTYRPWLKTAKGPIGRLSPALSAGTKLIRVIHPAADGRLHFSRLLRFESRAGQSEDRLLRLRPGMTVRGRLDDSVPRPVKNGYAVLAIVDEVPHEAGGGEELFWQTWVRLSADGEFRFEQLPPSNEVRILAWCDGFVSSNPPAEDLPTHLKARRNSVSMPQFFGLKDTGGADNLEVAMEPAAGCRFDVRQLRTGEPVQGARVGLSPNVIYSSNPISYGICLRYDILIRQEERSLLEWMSFYDQVRLGTLDNRLHVRPDFSAVTNSKGVAFIENLPARGTEVVSVNHDSLVPFGTLPPYRSGTKVQLFPGQTARVTLQLVPRPGPGRPSR